MTEKSLAYLSDTEHASVNTIKVLKTVKRFYILHRVLHNTLNLTTL